RCCSSASHLPTPPRSNPLSLPDALPISPHEVDLLAEQLDEARVVRDGAGLVVGAVGTGPVRPLEQLPDEALGRLHRPQGGPVRRDRKSTRLNSSHVKISYAVFCLKKKNK